MNDSPPIIEGGAPYGAAQRALINWLGRHGPDEWHRCALSYNWDSDLEPLHWIISQPRCDRGTAIAIFYMGEPGYYQVEADRLDMTELRARNRAYNPVLLMEAICQRWADGGYPEYRFSPRYSPDDVLGSVDAARMPWPVPPDLAQPVDQGVMLDASDYAEGYAPGLVAELDAARIPF